MIRATNNLHKPCSYRLGIDNPKSLRQRIRYYSSLRHSDIIWHRKGTDAQIAAPIKAGSKIAIKWDTWPVSHKWPTDFLANYNGPCETVDKTRLPWFKITQLALLDPKTS
jgi:cellulase